MLELTKSEISKLYTINYSSVQKIIKSFEQDGRTNKKQYIDLPYLSMIDEKSGGPSHNSKKIKKTGRGRKKLVVDPAVLDNRFGAPKSDINKARSSLKLYFVFEDNDKTSEEYNSGYDFQHKLKLFENPQSYPYDLPYKCKELEIVHLDQTQGDDVQNNTKDLFSGPL